MRKACILVRNGGDVDGNDSKRTTNKNAGIMKSIRTRRVQCPQACPNNKY